MRSNFGDSGMAIDSVSGDAGASSFSSGTIVYSSVLVRLFSFSGVWLRFLLNFGTGTGAMVILISPVRHTGHFYLTDI